MSKPVLRKKYHIKELTEDGLLKDPQVVDNGWNGIKNKFFGFGYDTREEAYLAIEEKDMGKDRTGVPYHVSGRYVILEQVQFVREDD